MRFKPMVVAIAAAGAQLAAVGCARAATPASIPTRDDAVALVAPGDCWGGAGHGVDAALAHCARIGADIAALSVEADAASVARACTTVGVCAPLDNVLAASPAPHLLLRTPVALLDEVQRIVAQRHAGSRTLVEPQVVRPSGSAVVDLSPGLRYRREYRSFPRPMMIHVVEANLARTGMEFVVTPGSQQAGKEFIAEKTSAFAGRMHTAVAVNATYFRPFEGGRLLASPYVPAIGQAVDADGLSIANGHVDSAAANPDPRSEGAFCVTPGAVSIVRGECPSTTQQAVGAGPVLLVSGQRQPLAGEPGVAVRDVPAGVASITVKELPAYYHDPQPRTAVGLDAGGRKMWFVVVDGRQAGYSEGITLPELTSLFAELGAVDAINLDGGGSSTLVLQTTGGDESLASTPIHTGIPGRERPVANHLGLRVVAPR